MILGSVNVGKRGCMTNNTIIPKGIFSLINNVSIKNNLIQNKIDRLWNYNVRKSSDNWTNLVIILDQLVKFYNLNLNQEVLLSKIIKELTRCKYLSNEECKKFIYLLSEIGLNVFTCLDNIPDKEKVLKSVKGFLEEEENNENRK